MNTELEHMQVRLFRYAWKKWGVGLLRCADIFDTFHVDQYIEDLYEFFHVQGDEANLLEIEHYLRNQGVRI